MRGKRSCYGNRISSVKTLARLIAESVFEFEYNYGYRPAGVAIGKHYSEALVARVKKRCGVVVTHVPQLTPRHYDIYPYPMPESRQPVVLTIERSSRD